MNIRGFWLYMILSIVGVGTTFGICRFARDFLGIFAYGILLFLVWSCLRLILISIRRINVILSLGCAASFVLEGLAIGDYAEFAYPEEFHSHMNLLSLLRVAIFAFLFGRILDYYILKPYFPRKPRQEIAI